MPRSPLLASLGLLVVLFANARADEPGDMQSLLAHPVLDQAAAILQLRTYCDQGVAPVPAFESAEQWRAEAQRLRDKVLDEVVFRGEAAKWREGTPKIEWLGEIPCGPGYRIKRLRFEALPGLWIPALLYEPEHLSGKVPAVLNVNGHAPEGKAYNPKQVRCVHMARNGMLALNLEWVGMGQLHTRDFDHERMPQIDLCGTSGLAVFYLNMSRAIDVLLSLENTDPERVAMTGLSGGAWQTIILSSLDTRVKLSVPVAGYSSFHTRAWHDRDLGDSEQAPNDLASICDYATMTAMVAPRPLLLVYNSIDNCCFQSGYALPLLLDAGLPAYRVMNRSHAIRWHVNDVPGTHNYERDNRKALYRMLRDFFLGPDSKFSVVEDAADNEIKTPEQLAVELPADNASFHSLAVDLAKDLPRDKSLPAGADDLAAWQAPRREALRKIVRATDAVAEAEMVGKAQKVAANGDAQKVGPAVTYWKIKVGHWTVPAVELVAGEPEKTAIVVADAGRAKAADQAARLLKEGYRVVAIDPLMIGEARPEDGFLFYRFALHVASTGGRSLGFQAEQLAATAAWLRERTDNAPVNLVAVGPRTSTSALVAAALAPDAIAQVELHDAFGSLKEVLDRNATTGDMPELFCFGLLESFDVPQIAALVAPRPVVFSAASDRAKKDLAPLADLYRALESDCKPLP
ncbi:MAG: acetylxylan esterase [Pirellulales bacterium]|nr:acetylxylan esterase [Pirellulales bacterium]